MNVNVYLQHFVRIEQDELGMVTVRQYDELNEIRDECKHIHNKASLPIWSFARMSAHVRCYT